jgi:uncharacterized protein
MSIPQSRLLELARQGEPRLINRIGGSAGNVVRAAYPLIVLFYSLLAPIIGTLLIVPFAILLVAVAPNLSRSVLDNYPDLVLTVGLVAGFTPIILLVWLWVRAVEGRRLASIGLERLRAGRLYLRGLLIGLALFSAAVGLLILSGAAVPADDVWAPNVTALPGVLLAFAGWGVQGAAEEVLTRGFLLPIVAIRWGTATGVILSALAFALLHMLNPNLSVLAMFNLALFGLFACLYALREGGIWGICAAHSVWNWAQTNLFGFPVSGGLPPGSSLLELTGSGPAWLSGGAFGPEGGIAVSAVLLAGCLLAALPGSRAR